MSLTQRQSDALLGLLNKAVERRIQAVKRATNFDDVVEEVSETIVSEFLGDDIEILVQTVLASEQRVKDAEAANKEAKTVLSKQLTDFIRTARENKLPVAKMWDTVNRYQWAGSNNVADTDVSGVKSFARFAAKERVKELSSEKFADISRLEALRDNLETLLIMATSPTKMAQMVKTFYQQFTDTEDTLAMQVIEEVFPFLFIEGEE